MPGSPGRVLAALVTVAFFAAPAGAETSGSGRLGRFAWLTSSTSAPSAPHTARPPATPGELRWGGELREGSTPRADGTRFVLRSHRASRVVLELFGPFQEVLSADLQNHLGTPRAVVLMERKGNLWVADVPGVGPGEVYGYRCWGPNWPYDPAFQPGTSIGFLEDVDDQGNRFNPNKLLIDPYTRSLTRDPDWTGHTHASGPEHRDADSAPWAGKSVVVDDDAFEWGRDSRPATPLRESLIYEVHVRGMTRDFPGLANPGTYSALADPRVIAYLKQTGVTAVELLPIHEAPNDVNDVDPTDTLGKNYWGYMTLAYFAPDRRYSADRSFDGPVREFKAMVKALHAAGIEVICDVVFNHTDEGGTWKGPDGGLDVATIHSLRGIDNALYYELAGGNRSFYDNTGIGANLRTAAPEVQDFLVESMRYFVEELHVDGFRFDLASVLGNSKDRDGFAFQKRNGLLDRIAETFGYRQGDMNDDAGRVKLIAEPWAIGDDSYQVGNFPWGWAEWNGKYRDSLRRFLKGEAGAGEMMERVYGSHGLYGDDGRRPHQGINFVTAHDGLTLFDLVSFDVNSEAERDALNTRAWPYGPSDGGEGHNNSWNSRLPGASDTDTASLRRQQARNAYALLMLSQGTPMVLGGDERLRTTHGNNNTYNLDNEVTWLEWGPTSDRLDELPDRTHHLDGVITPGVERARYRRFAAAVAALRRDHPAFHAPGWWSADRDRDGDGYPAVSWWTASGRGVDGNARHFGYRLEGAAEELGLTSGADHGLMGRDLFVVVNADGAPVDYPLPAPAVGEAWFRVLDTDAWAEPEGNSWRAEAAARIGARYTVRPRSLAAFVQRPE